MPKPIKIVAGHDGADLTFKIGTLEIVRYNEHFVTIKPHGKKSFWNHINKICKIHNLGCELRMWDQCAPILHQTTKNGRGFINHKLDQGLLHSIVIDRHASSKPPSARVSTAVEVPQITIKPKWRDL